MSNHYHLVLHIDADRASRLTDSEVIERWLTLFSPPPLIQRHLQSQLTDKAELAHINKLIETWRSRLCNLSWYMRELNEYIARLANAEDKCTGHFWESRFKSQALLDETALFSCMAYVDLNPIRANMAETPEQSDYTSIQERLEILPSASRVKQNIQQPTQDKAKAESTKLMSFSGSIKHSTARNELPYNFSDYLQLVDWTGRIIREDKRGSIPSDVPPILKRLNVQPEQWLSTCTRIEKDYYLAIGPIASLEEFAERLQQHWLKGINACQRLYSAAPAN